MRSWRATSAVGMCALIAGLLSAPSALGQSPSASPAPDAVSPPWTRVDAPLLATVDTIEHAATLGREVVAIGTRCDGEGVCGRVALATPDGLAWEERGPLPADVEVVGELVADKGALIAVGRTADGVGGIWRSVDAGATWSADDDRRAFKPGTGGGPRRSPATGNPDEVTVTSVARGPNGLVAGGWLNSEDDDRSAIWRETGPGTWERVRLRPAMERAGGVFDIAGGVDAYVSVTADSLWRSADGRRWERLQAGDATGPITDVEPITDGFIGLAVGRSVTPVWGSPRAGSAWQRRPDDAALTGLWEAELRAFGEMVVAVGSRTGDELVPTVWDSEPGASWDAETVTDVRGVRLEDVATSGETLLVVGNAPDGAGSSTGAAWLREAPPG